MPFIVPKPACDAKEGAPIAAGIVFVAPDGDVLLLRRASTEPNYGGHFGLPGGKAEDGETAQDAATREFREECGLDIDMNETLKLIDRVDTPNGMQFSTFACPAKDKFVPVLDGEHSGYCWASLDQLPQPLHPSVARTLGQHLGAAADMTPEDWDGLKEGLAAWIHEEQDEPEHAADAEFEESKHPRAANGEFGKGSGGGKKAASTKDKPKPGEVHRVGAYGVSHDPKSDRPYHIRKDGASWLESAHKTLGEAKTAATRHHTEAQAYQAKQQAEREAAKAKANSPAERAKRSVSSVTSAMQGMGGEVVHGAETDANGNTTFSVRYAGDWQVPDGEEDDGDYDWKELTDASAAKIKTRLDAIEKEHGVKISAEPGEKEYIHFTISPGAGAKDGAMDAVMAYDRSLYDARGKRIMIADRLALDRAPSARHYDADGHLHISRTPISKANVCEYWGHEIPGADELGLEPNRKYSLLRHPDELAKAAKSSNGKQLLLGHVPVSADDPKKDKQVGSTGTDAEFAFPYLYNSLHLHDREGIDAIEAADKDKASDDTSAAPKGAKELSSAYRYRADMTPGVFQGAPYDGVMRDIDFNHVALVPEGRAGADVVVADSKLQEKELNMSKVLTRFAAASVGALGVYLEPKLAQDAKLDLTPFFVGVTKRNFAGKKAKIAADIKAAAKSKLAADASLDDMHNFMDRCDKATLNEGADADPNSGLPMNAEELAKKAKDEADEEEAKKKEASDKKAADRKGARDAFLKEKGMDEKDIEAMDALMESEEAEDGESEEAEEDADGKKVAAKGEAKDKKGLDKKAMDQALKAHGDAIRRQLNETAQAYADVEPFVGKLALGMDSAADVYRTALKGLGMDAKAVDKMHPDALKPVLQAQKKAGEKSTGGDLAMDAAGDSTGFHSRWGAAAGRVGHA